MARNARPGKGHDENGGPNLDVQVQIERDVMVDYDQKTRRTPRILSWDRKRSEVKNEDTIFVDQGQWELSSVDKMTDTV